MGSSSAHRNFITEGKRYEKLSSGVLFIFRRNCYNTSFVSSLPGSSQTKGIKSEGTKSGPFVLKLQLPHEDIIKSSRMWPSSQVGMPHALPALGQSPRAEAWTVSSSMKLWETVTSME